MHCPEARGHKAHRNLAGVHAFRQGRSSTTACARNHFQPVVHGFASCRRGGACPAVVLMAAAQSLAVAPPPPLPPSSILAGKYKLVRRLDVAGAYGALPACGRTQSSTTQLGSPPAPAPSRKPAAAAGTRTLEPTRHGRNAPATPTGHPYLAEHLESHVRPRSLRPPASPPGVLA